MYDYMGLWVYWVDNVELKSLSCEWLLPSIAKKGLCRYDYIKDIEMSLSWLLYMDYKYNHLCFCKKEANGRLMHTDRKGEGNVTVEAETRVIQP